ncbi:MAG: DeoR/GlpR family DNA-binding transcription regulator [Clostridia bacterium]
MSKNELKIDARRSAILEQLRRDGQVRVSQLSDQFCTTVVTIRSDLSALERDGYLERTPGGAIQTVKNFYNLDFNLRQQEHMPAKKSIATAAADLVKDGDTLLINSGTTTYFTAIALKKHKNLNVVTNSIYVAMELGSTPTFRVILLGGEINAQYAFSYGEDAKEQLSRYKADYAILSMDGVCSQTGLTTYHAEESIIDRMMMERAHETIIVADNSKIEHESFSHVCGLDSIGCWVTDQQADPALAERIAHAGISIIFA